MTKWTALEILPILMIPTIKQAPLLLLLVNKLLPCTIAPINHPQVLLLLLLLVVVLPIPMEEPPRLSNKKQAITIPATTIPMAALLPLPLFAPLPPPPPLASPLRPLLNSTCIKIVGRSRPASRPKVIFAVGPMPEATGLSFHSNYSMPVAWMSRRPFSRKLSISFMACSKRTKSIPSVAAVSRWPICNTIRANRITKLLLIKMRKFICKTRATMMMKLRINCTIFPKFPPWKPWRPMLSWMSWPWSKRSAKPPRLCPKRVVKN
mmetsp:Transcript_8824/g.14660  ORF Transcript_8824/g.14660 Transcript_8824/m.14660 type:complete len:264 (-) Transcript_8824:1030-1821(-)